ncbi:MAG: flippase, partial [Hyphomicrobiales bacterium]
TILLSRTLGIEQYGIYIFVFGIVNLLLIPADAGLPTLMTREIVKGRTDQKTSSVTAVILWSLLLILILGTVTATAWFASGMFFPDSRISWNLRLWSIGLLFGFALLYWVTGIIQGFEKPIHYALPNGIIRQVLFLTILLVSLTYVPLTAEMVMAIHFFAICIAVLWAASIAMRSIRTGLPDFGNEKPNYQSKDWFRSLLPLSLVKGVGFLNHRVDIVMIGMLSTVVAVGGYGVALQFSALLLIAQTSINALIGPKIVRAYRTENYTYLQKLVSYSVTISSVFALFFALILVFLGQYFLEFVIGREFLIAYPIIVILVVGQIFSACSGPTALLLNMTDHEKKSLITGINAAVLNIILNLALIPFYGAIGAAIATSLSLAAIQVQRGYMVRKYIKIKPDIIYALTTGLVGQR